MAIELPRATSQAGGTPTVFTSGSKGTTTGQDLLALAGAIAPSLARAADRKQAQQQAEAAAAEEVAVGSIIADMNQVDLDLQLATEATDSLQKASLEVARARADNEITEEEQAVIDSYLEEEKKLKLLKQQRPTAFSQMQSQTKKAIIFQNALSANPRLAGKLITTRNALSNNSSSVSGSQAKQVMEIEQKLSDLYGQNPTAQQRAEFAQFEVMETRNKEIERRNTIKAQQGSLSLDSILQSTTANLDLSLTKLDTKFVNDLNAGGGFAKSERVEQYVSQLRVLQKQLENQIYSSVAEQNKTGMGNISRDSVNERVLKLRAEFDARIEMYQSKDSSTLLKTINEFQKNYIAINGGNAVTTARQVSGVRGDNIGALMANNGLLKNSDPVLKGNLEKLYQQSGMDMLTDSVDIFATRLSVMMNEGIPLPANLQRAGVYHGVISMREGPVSENTKSQVLEGVSSIANEDSISEAVKILNDPSSARQLSSGEISGPQLKQTVAAMDLKVSNEIREEGASVVADPDTGELVVFKAPVAPATRGQMSRNKPASEFSVQELFETVRTFGRQGGERRTSSSVNLELTKELNALMSLRKNPAYSKVLEGPASYSKFWLNTFNFNKDKQPEATAAE